MLKWCYFKLHCIQTLYLCSRMAYSCCLSFATFCARLKISLLIEPWVRFEPSWTSLGGNLDFQDILQNTFFNIDYCPVLSSCCLLVAANAVFWFVVTICPSVWISIWGSIFFVRSFVRSFGRHQIMQKHCKLSFHLQLSILLKEEEEEEEDDDEDDRKYERERERESWSSRGGGFFSPFLWTSFSSGNKKLPKLFFTLCLQSNYSVHFFITSSSCSSCSSSILSLTSRYCKWPIL